MSHGDEESYSAEVFRDFRKLTTDLFVYRRRGNHIEFIGADGLPREFKNGEPPEPMLALPAEVIPAITAALVTYVSGVQDARALRRDYDAERERVDKFIAWFLGGEKK